MDSRTCLFYKKILRKVSFNHDLFCKELGKAISILPKEEAYLLIKWSEKIYEKNNDDKSKCLAILKI